jgi:glycosyltransferase involved in cell wall biosynthesis
MRVCVVAEYYPRRRDPVSGAWAHRQAIAARDAGADVHVLVLERPLPSAAAVRDTVRGRPGASARELRAAWAQPRRDTIDGIEVEYVRFASPPRERSYASWHRWAARPLARALDSVHQRAPLDLVHAHYALPAGGAALHWTRKRGLPLVVSVHGGDLLSPLLEESDVAKVLKAAAVVIANSGGMLDTAAGRAGSAERMRVIHPPGEPPPADPPPKRSEPTIATLGNLDPRKRHIDVLDALAELPEEVRWVVIGAGPERARLETRAAELGLTERIEWTGALPPKRAIAELIRCHAMALPSVDEAFGVAYAEALLCRIAAIGCAGEPGPEEIASLGPGLTLVPPRNPAALASAITDALEADPLPPAEHFSLATCGRRTVEAYEDALR